jgi:hypothetical protein
MIIKTVTLVQLVGGWPDGGVLSACLQLASSTLTHCFVAAMSSTMLAVALPQLKSLAEHHAYVFCLVLAQKSAGLSAVLKI